ncbi:DNA-binding NarL/FixJ family response regulator [Pedobacter cryoconitis]|uniref:DNA-binding NarL/FixJ family response regulator n=1 Tax=Pedobacter cryoconitis TaxID=188932 RepID=A0A7W8YWD5_9SPHI|nr:response regulator transcription factor [Pedobacter cryoconitis]MBB5622991.1 DNA-binding NarL/FixJ family response regulator [Pedobacter cryoconitis]MBB5644962.1 DNA-binding NarL/FixJ family response regulator [Pedobacter cryoconitis]
MIPLKIAIADDQKIFRKGLTAIVNDIKEFDLVFETGNGFDLLHQLSSKKPDVIIIDIKLPGLDDLKMLDYIKANFENIKILMLSTIDEGQYIIKVMKAGASGYLLKDSEPEEIIMAIREVYEKGFYFNKHLSITLIKELLVQPPATIGSKEAMLNDREIDILKLICEESTNIEIAKKLFLSVRTVEGYRTKLFEKIGSKKIAGLVIYAVKNGIIHV